MCGGEEWVGEGAGGECFGELEMDCLIIVARVDTCDDHSSLNSTGRTFAAQSSYVKCTTKLSGEWPGFLELEDSVHFSWILN